MQAVTPRQVAIPGTMKHGRTALIESRHLTNGLPSRKWLAGHQRWRLSKVPVGGELASRRVEEHRISRRL
jgi:hypothetical protein